MILGEITLGADVDVTQSASINHIRTGNRGKIRDFSVLFGSPDHPLTIGDDFFIGAQCYVNGCAGLTIGNRVTIAPGVMIFSDSGPNTSPLLQKTHPIVAKPIIIGDDVWIGARAMILPGVTIGNRCIIGAGSLVKNNVPDGTVVAGQPAKEISRLDA
ncbi:MAG TPA: acyltransferase [Candidatus Peribacteraceae bacterium]|nr:acyltransferase [Candidatus Peribacteraceae bacterium]